MRSQLLTRLQELKQIKKLKKILLTGSQGQLGIELLPYLKYIYGDNNIIATDIRKSSQHPENVQFEYLDVTDKNKYLQICS